MYDIVSYQQLVMIDRQIYRQIDRQIDIEIQIDIDCSKFNLAFAISNNSDFNNINIINNINTISGSFQI